MSNWIANLPLRWKFALLGVLAILMTAAPSVNLLTGALRTFNGLKAEDAGLVPAKAVLDLVRLTQEHRGLSAGVLNGATGKSAQRQERQGQVEQAWARLSQAMTLMAGSERLTPEMTSIQQGWKTLASDVSSGKVSSPESTARHTELIGRQLLLVEDIVEVSGMALDTDTESYYLIVAAFRDMPRLTEKLGQARALGNATLVKQSTSPENAQALLGMLEASGIHAVDAKRDLDKSGILNQADAAELAAAFKLAHASLTKGHALVQSVAHANDLGGMDPGNYFKAMTEVILAQFAASDEIVQRLDELMDRRLAAERASLLLTISLIAGMMAVGAFVAIVITQVSTRAVKQAVDAAQALADGDLTQRIHSDQRDEIGDLLRATGAAVEQLKHIITGIRTASDSVATASSQIAQGNLDLSSRTEQQASSLQQTASSMEEMSATVSQNASAAQNANRMALEASTEAQRSGEVFSQVLTKMAAIKQASSKIAEINAVIDGIAFQTNILALNAAVEAARAGEHGRGFAVVASEVRTLAQRSSQAAREIKGLINNTTQSVEEGYGLANETNAFIERLVSQVRGVSQLMGDIATGSEQQHVGITQVNQAVNQLDQTTQQNAALVEEASAAAASLHEQAHRLQSAVGRFKLA